MSLDQKLREDLARIANGVHPDVEYHLSRVLDRSRRQTRTRLAARVVAVAALVAVVVLFDVNVGRDQPPVLDSLSGTFTATVEPGQPVLDREGMAGVWTLRLDRDGGMEVIAPDTYRGILSAVLYQSTRDSFRTNLFEEDLCSGHGLGSYAWQFENGTLTFTTVEDSCGARLSLLADRAWKKDG